MTSTKDIIDHHLKAFADRDLNGVLSDYAPGTVFFTQYGPLHGPDAIRPLFRALMIAFSKVVDGLDPPQLWFDSLAPLATA